VRIVAHEFEFAPMVDIVPANRPFTLVLDNAEGLVEHDVDVPGLGGLHIHAMPRSEARSTMVINAPPGNYVFSCTLPGHRAAGMRGSIAVSPA
jgi:Copper binding proteins, plastocyanin/azurin family